MANGNGNDHALHYVTPNRFYVEVVGEISAYFTECSGLAAEIKKNVYMEGGLNHQQRIYLGQTTFTDVTLKRGLTNHLGFWEWARQAMQEKVKRKNVSILTFNQAGETMQSWTLIGAVPIAWKAPILQASDSNTVAIEELRLAYEGLEVSGKKGSSIDVSRKESQFFL
jgi:phage tail-like protein